MDNRQVDKLISRMIVVLRENGFSFISYSVWTTLHNDSKFKRLLLASKL